MHFSLREIIDYIYPLASIENDENEMNCINTDTFVNIRFSENEIENTIWLIINATKDIERYTYCIILKQQYFKYKNLYHSEFIENIPKLIDFLNTDKKENILCINMMKLLFK